MVLAVRLNSVSTNLKTNCKYASRHAVYSVEIIQCTSAGADECEADFMMHDDSTYNARLAYYAQNNARIINQARFH